MKCWFSACWTLKLHGASYQRNTRDIFDLAIAAYRSFGTNPRCQRLISHIAAFVPFRFVSAPSTIKDPSILKHCIHLLMNSLVRIYLIRYFLIYASRFSSIMPSQCEVYLIHYGSNKVFLDLGIEYVQHGVRMLSLLHAKIHVFSFPLITA